MNISKALTEQIYQVVNQEVDAGKAEGVIPGYKLHFYLDKKPEMPLITFPLDLLIPGRTETVYIGGKLES
jgi:hypothetical protein